jgi:hypothetical protein
LHWRKRKQHHRISSASSAERAGDSSSVGTTMGAEQECRLAAQAVRHHQQQQSARVNGWIEHTKFKQTLTKHGRSFALCTRTSKTSSTNTCKANHTADSKNGSAERKSNHEKKPLTVRFRQRSSTGTATEAHPFEVAFVLCDSKQRSAERKSDGAHTQASNDRTRWTQSHPCTRGHAQQEHRQRGRGKQKGVDAHLCAPRTRVRPPSRPPPQMSARTRVRKPTSA